MHFRPSCVTSDQNGTGAFEFRPYTKDMECMVKAFNERLGAGGVEYKFRETHMPALPHLPGRDVYQEAFVVVEGGQVRGTYQLQHQKYAIRGTVQRIGVGPQLPLSEGIVNPKYVLVGVLLLRHALVQQPLLFGVGIGGMQEAFARVLRAMGWTMHLVPFYFKVINPARFLENIRYLRSGRTCSRILDLLRNTGLGWAAARTVHFRFVNSNPSVQTDRVVEFGRWADVLWDRCRDKYSLIAVRDSASLNVLYPTSDPRFLRLRVSRGDKTIGWAVLLDTQMSENKYFGNMRVGAIVDCLALPRDSLPVTRAATQFLERRQVDLIVSNQESAAWRHSLVSSGFVRGPSNFVLTISKQLAERLRPWDELRDGVHTNRGDGDGPINL